VIAALFEAGDMKRYKFLDPKGDQSVFTAYINE